MRFIYRSTPRARHRERAFDVPLRGRAQAQSDPLARFPVWGPTNTVRVVPGISLHLRRFDQLPGNLACQRHRPLL